MAVINPPGFLQNAGAVHTAEQMRNWFGLLVGGRQGTYKPRAGVSIGHGSALAVTQTGSPSMAVLVGTGLAGILGTESVAQGMYCVLNDASVTLSIAASHATLNRIDLVVFKVEDSGYSGVANASSLAVVTGTPASSPAPPTIPQNALVLAEVAVNANVTSIVNSNITDRRTFLAANGGLISVANQGERDTMTAYDSLGIFRRDTESIEIHDGGAWNLLAKASIFQPWQSFTPVPTGTMVFGTGNTVVGRFLVVGSTVYFRMSITLGTGFVIGDAGVSLPTGTPNVNGTPVVMGMVDLLDSSAALTYAGVWRRWTTGLAFWYHLPSTGVLTAISSTAPFTWASGDVMRCQGFYEV